MSLVGPRPVLGVGGGAVRRRGPGTLPGPAGPDRPVAGQRPGPADHAAGAGARRASTCTGRASGSTCPSSPGPCRRRCGVARHDASGDAPEGAALGSGTREGDARRAGRSRRRLDDGGRVDGDQPGDRRRTRRRHRGRARRHRVRQHLSVHQLAAEPGVLRAARRRDVVVAADPRAGAAHRFRRRAGDRAGGRWLPRHHRARRGRAHAGGRRAGRRRVAPDDVRRPGR